MSAPDQQQQPQRDPKRESRLIAATLGGLLVVTAGLLYGPSLFHHQDESSTPAAPSQPHAPNPSPPVMPPAPAQSPVPTNLPQDDDSANSPVHQVVSRVMQRFATVNVAQNNPADPWASSFSSNTTDHFTNLARTQFDTLYSGALQAGTNAVNAHVQDARPVWSEPQRQLWRVTVTHDLRSTNVPEMNTSSTWTWDVLLVPDQATWKADAFSAPSPAHDSPATYQRPEVSQ